MQILLSFLALDSLSLPVPTAILTHVRKSIIGCAYIHIRYLIVCNSSYLKLREIAYQGVRLLISLFALDRLPLHVLIAIFTYARSQNTNSLWRDSLSIHAPTAILTYVR